MFRLWVWCAVAFGLSMFAGEARAQRLHTVRPGQTWSAIAKRYRVGVWDLAMANRKTPTRALRVGQELIVPARGITYVRAGQTLSRIARAHDCSVGELLRLNHLSDGAGLRAGQRLILPGFDPGVDRRKDWGAPEQPGRVLLRRGEERFALQLVDAQGRVLEPGLRALGRAMTPGADPGTSARVQLPHPRLARLLAAISDHFGGRELQLVSGYRQVGGFTRGGSRHVRGRAADISVAGVSRRTLFEFCRSLSHTGCGYYPRSVFVHVDARVGSGQWVDWSPPGGRPRYGTLRRPYRRREQRRPDRPREGRQITRPGAVPRVVEVVDERGELVWYVDDRPSGNVSDERTALQN